MGFPIETKNPAQKHVEQAAQGEEAARTLGLLHDAARNGQGVAEHPSSQRPGRSDGKGSFPDAAAHWIAVAGGLGFAPLAPGTAGSLGAALFFVGCFLGAAALAPPSGPSPAASTLWFAGLFAVLILAVLWLGIWASGRAECRFETHDDQRIVIDEVVGQWIALFPLIFLIEPGRDDFFRLFLGVVTAFVLFRLFDVWKPGAVRWAERHFEGGQGVMADDVVAGGYGAAGLVAVHLLFGPSLNPLVRARVFDDAMTVGRVVGDTFGNTMLAGASV